MFKWEEFYKQFITYGGYKTVLKGLSATLQIAVFGLIASIIGLVFSVFSAVVSISGIFNALS